MIAKRPRSHKLAGTILVASLLIASCAGIPEPVPLPAAAHQAPRFKPARPVVVIPGFGNSKLRDPVTDTVVWGSARSMVRTVYDDDLDLPVDPATGGFGFDRLVPNGGFVGSRGPINIAWRIARGLESHGDYHRAPADGDAHDPAEIHPFAWDFRLSATENARRLDAFIEAIRARHGDPSLRVDVIAHSAGGLVALTYAKLGTADLEHPETWDDASRAAASKIGKLILVAVPQEGTNETIRVLVRGEKLVRREWPPAMMASFPSIAEMLPATRSPFVDEAGTTIEFDVWDADAWREAGFGIYSSASTEWFRRKGEDPASVDRAFRASLDRAARLREALRTRELPGAIELTAIAGNCTPTAERVLLRADRTIAVYPSELRPGEERLQALLFAPGDGSIPASSATAHSSRNELFCKGHQGIASDPGVHHALLRALSPGAGATSERALDASSQGLESATFR